MLRLAIRGPFVKGDDVEESQSRVSPAKAGEDEYVEFCPPELWRRASSPVLAVGIA
jgi:hypothetical protein